MARAFTHGRVTGVVDVSGLFRRGGSIWDWHYAIAREVETEAKRLAPRRSGNLARNIRMQSPSRDVGRGYSYLLEARVSSRARYSTYVHEGVEGYITARSGGYMRLSSIPRGASWADYPTHAKRVRGQDSNPFLNRALGNVGYSHRWRPGRGFTIAY